MPVLNRIADMADEMKGWRRHLHQYPELEFDCHETAAFIEARLREMGVDEIHPAIARSEHFTFTAPFTGLEVFPAAGTVIGHHDGPGLGEPVTTPYDDCLLVMPSTRQAREGVTVVRFARRAPQLRYRRKRPPPRVRPPDRRSGLAATRRWAAREWPQAASPSIPPDRRAPR